jgi:alkylation response protein AidB-like acyl-CoA dehydrogenase
MKMIEHPSAFIKPEQIATMRNVAREAEQMKHLHPEQIAIIHKQKWFELFVPVQFNGLGLSLPEALQLEEALAWTDGSVGWTVTLCAGAGWFIGFLDPEIVSIVFDKPNICIAGSGKASGIAKTIDDGFEITGYWDYATGANSATSFTANCMIEEYGAILKNEDGSPVIKSFLFLKDEVRIHETWKQIGMIATGSNSFEVNGLRVKNNRAFLIDYRSAVLKDPIYQYPFLQFAETTLAVNSSGMAIRFLDLCELLFRQKSTGTMRSDLQTTTKELEEVRELFYSTAIKSWEECVTKLFYFCAVATGT